MRACLDLSCFCSAFLCFFGFVTVCCLCARACVCVFYSAYFFAQLSLEDDIKRKRGEWVRPGKRTLRHVRIEGDRKERRRIEPKAPLLPKIQQFNFASCLSRSWSWHGLNIFFVRFFDIEYAVII